MNNLINKFAVAALVAIANLSASAETVIFQQDFNGNYTEDFPYWLDHDGLTPNDAIKNFFYSSTYEAYMPWWVAKESNESQDVFMISHSYYNPAGKSSDWFITRQITIPSKGFVLEFDAQSLPVRSVDRLSDLTLYVTEELIDPPSLPTVPAKVWTAIPYGKDPDIVEGDWEHFSLSLDDYAGKTVYLNFVNENNDKDILCLDNVKIARNDVALLAMSEVDEYTAETEYTVSLTVTAEKDVINGVVELTSNGVSVNRWEIGKMTPGQTVTLSESVPVTLGEKNEIAFVFTTDSQEWAQTAAASITGLAFEPVHRLFVEETTSLHCGNCPVAMYNFEMMLEDKEIKDRFLPVSVHIAGMGYDPMATSAYYTKLPESNTAPLVFAQRSTSYDGFIPAYDMVYNPEDENSFAYRMTRLMDAPTYLDVDVKAKWVVNPNDDKDTTAVKCTAIVRPALNIEGADLRVAFILSENNVGINGSVYWMQSNYFSGLEVEGDMGGWTTLSDPALNLRYHDVARAISAYDGHLGSVPADMEAGKDYEFEFTMTVPDTYAYDEVYGLKSDAIHTDYCCVTAIVIDVNTGLVVNAARVPMSDVAEKRLTVKEMAGVEDIAVDPAADSDAPAEYFDLTGRRVSDSYRGFVIVRRGSAATKQLQK